MPTLFDLQDQESAVILALRLPEAVAARMMELGLFEGQRVTLLRRAPMGDPLEVQVAGARLSLRGADAKLIEVGP